MTSTGTDSANEDARSVASTDRRAKSKVAPSVPSASESFKARRQAALELETLRQLLTTVTGQATPKPDFHCDGCTRSTHPIAVS